MSRTVANCNRSFIIEALLQNKRLDGRSLHQFRNLQVNYGQTFGSCYVQLGHTIIFASTEATIDEPRLTRPAEGRFKMSMNICAGGKEKWLRNIERSQPMEGVLTMRLIEKIINRINVLDLESLCLVVGRAVWCINTKLVLFNYDGNMIEAASIATIASLMHFRRPEATVTPDGDVIVHTLEESNPIPLTLFHYPICITFQFMDHTLLRRIMRENQELFPDQHCQQVQKAMKLMICDPTEEEEDFLRNVLVICANTYKEIVAIQSLGRISLSSFASKLLKDCTTKAFERVHFVTDYLKTELEKHNKSSLSAKNVSLQRTDNFYEAMKNGQLCIVNSSIKNDMNGFTLTAAPDEDNDTKEKQYDIDEKISSFLAEQRQQSHSFGDGGLSKWGIVARQEFDNEDEENDDEEEELDESGAIQPSMSFAHKIGFNANKQDLPKSKLNQFKVTNQTQFEPPNVLPQTSMTTSTNVQSKQNQWIKVESSKKKNQEEFQKMTKSQRKRHARNKALREQRGLPSNLKIPEPITDSDEDEVVLLDSEYKK